MASQRANHQTGYGIPNVDIRIFARARQVSANSNLKIECNGKRIKLSWNNLKILVNYLGIQEILQFYSKSLNRTVPILKTKKNFEKYTMKIVHIPALRILVIGLPSQRSDPLLVSGHRFCIQLLPGSSVPNYDDAILIGRGNFRRIRTPTNTEHPVFVTLQKLVNQTFKLFER